MKIRRIAALALSLAILFAALLIPAHAAPKACGCGEVLQVWVDGFGQALFYGEGTPDEREAGMMVTDNIMDSVPALLLGGAMTLPSLSWDPLAGGISGVLYSLLGHLQLDENGKSVEPIGSHWVIDEAQDHKTRPEFWFRYDFRLDPFELAAQLNDFIETLCKKTGHSKIALTGHSEGTNVVMTYIKEYGTKRVETLILANGGWQGLTLAGQLFTKQFALDGPAIANFIANMLGTGYDPLTHAAMDLLRTSNLLWFAPLLGRGIKNTVMDPLFEQALVPLFCQMPAVWAFIPDEYFADALQMLGDDPKYDGLKAKVSKFHYEVMNQSPALLKKAKAGGVKVAVIASYGNAPIPVTADSTYHSDRLIDSALEAGGATIAPYGQTLPPGSSKYRSPDGVIDAATCAMPDQTWFVKYNWHNPDCLEELRQWIIHSKSYPSIHSNPDFPQYLRRAEDGRAIPLEGPDDPPPETFGQAVLGLGKAVWGQLLP